jgi:hypothetical protein
MKLSPASAPRDDLPLTLKNFSRISQRLYFLSHIIYSNLSRRPTLLRTRLPPGSLSHLAIRPKSILSSAPCPSLSMSSVSRHHTPLLWSSREQIQMSCTSCFAFAQSLSVHFYAPYSCVFSGQRSVIFVLCTNRFLFCAYS